MNKVVLFFVWPLAAFFISLRNKLSTKGDRIVLTLFSGFIGLNLAIDSDNSDINRYTQDFESYRSNSFWDLWDYIVHYFQFDSDYFDIGVQVIYYLTSRLSGDPRILYITFGLIFGALFTNLMHFVMQNSNLKDNYNRFFFMLLLICIFPTQGINQFRFWTASMIFLLGIKNYFFLNQKKNGLLIAFSSVLVHIGLFLPIVILLVTLLVRKSKASTLFILVVVINIFTFGLSQNLDDLFAIVGGPLQAKYLNYTNEISAAQLEGYRNRVWYAAYWHELMSYSLFLILLPLFWNIKKISPQLSGFYRFLLVCMMVIGITRGMLMFFRYFELFIFVMLVIILFYRTETGNQKLTFRIWAFSPVLLLFLGIKISQILLFMEPDTLYSNPILSYFISGQKSIWHAIDLIR